MHSERDLMSIKKAELLVVDDDQSLRTVLCLILAESGYGARSAEDGFSALVEMRTGVPDIILCDLNMAGMSGFEFLSVVRRRFPAVQTIAMSGAYLSDGVPAGISADAFYEKGTSFVALLGIIDGMSRPERSQQAHHRHDALAPIWIPKNDHDPLGRPYVVITCLDCLRTFPQMVGDSALAIHDTACVYCHSSIHYAIVQPNKTTSGQLFRPRPGAGGSAVLNFPEFN
jgi:CheY-like chemotaxis protein